MSVLHEIHSWVRYLVLIGAVVAALAAIFAMVRPVDGERASRIGLTAFVGILDLQLLLGIALLVVWPFYPMLIGHIVMMVLAVVVAHGGAVLARRRAARGMPAAGFRLGTAVLALVLLVGGIMAIQRPVI